MVAVLVTHDRFDEPVHDHGYARPVITPPDRWPTSDLLRRCARSLDWARDALGAVRTAHAAPGAHPTDDALLALRRKVVAETAVLLLTVWPVRHLAGDLRDRAEALADELVPLARDEETLVRICLEPGLALDHAVAHVILSHLGRPSAAVDELVASSLAMGTDFGPERLAHRRLEREWLSRMWDVRLGPRRCRSFGTASMVGRPIDALGSTRLDLYAFTHGVMYTTDLGDRPTALPRPTADVTADAEAGLACSLDADDLDLTAELAATWPMLDAPLSPVATFAFALLARVEDAFGFLPGLGFDHQCAALPNPARHRAALRTSYHPTYVMGMLCALAARSGRGPARHIPTADAPAGATDQLLALLPPMDREPRWRSALQGLDRASRDALAPLVLTILLRRATAQGDLALVRRSIQAALPYGLVDAPAPRHTVATLRRSTVLDSARRRLATSDL